MMKQEGKIRKLTVNEQTTRQLTARLQLRRVALRTRHSQERLRGSEPDAEIAEWKGLVALRWSVIEQFDYRGHRYLLARRNEQAVPAAVDLSTREAEAVSLASLGHSNKVIAYELGISASTVGVLLHRAARKLGAKSRDGLIRKFRESLLAERA
jgi:DNA-binding CsgD family transcriptional regulator